MAGASPYIGSIYGIPVELHWTFIIMMLLALAISFNLFLIFVLLFICVFLHELAHSVTAIRNNISVKKIVLYPLGGGSIIDLDDIPPKLEFRIAIAGPVSSFLLGFIFGIMVIFIPAGTVKLFVQLLFVLNILLAVFNILPWFPLDGGRVLRSYLEKKRDFLSATKLTVNISNVIIVLFIISTVAFVAVENGYSLLYKEFIVLWDVFIAVFLYGGAKAELQGAYVKEYTRGVKLRAALSNNYIMLKGRPTIHDIYSSIMKSHKHIILFRENGKIYVISRIPQNMLASQKVQNIEIGKMSMALQEFEESEQIYSVYSKMQSDGIGIAAVLRKGKFVGIVQMQHLESLISLHMAHVKGNSKNINN
ncbi:MAG: M50 family metallopeptidase [Candidatus Marsarchaeota archaeon]|jgi:Zn-dependent protease|nr:M50 family metallopeptidase [Candidatus Marsarchaeota archaeon]